MNEADIKVAPSVTRTGDRYNLHKSMYFVGLVEGVVDGCEDGIDFG